jgi:hypothetical protein
MTFYPEDASVPTELRTDSLVLRMLGPDVVEPDYEAVMETRDRLRAWSNSDWPADDFTLDGNLEDMHMHEAEHMAREAFAFTVLSADESRVEGCCYIEPLEGLLQRRRIVPVDGQEPLPDATPVVGFWVRESALSRDLDRQLLDGLVRWFAEAWPFVRAMFLTNDSQQRDQRILREMGLPLAATLCSIDADLRWQLWSIPLR